MRQSHGPWAMGENTFEDPTAWKSTMFLELKWLCCPPFIDRPIFIQSLKMSHGVILQEINILGGWFLDSYMPVMLFIFMKHLNLSCIWVVRYHLITIYYFFITINRSFEITSLLISMYSNLYIFFQTFMINGYMLYKWYYVGTYFVDLYLLAN